MYMVNPTGGQKSYVVGCSMYKVNPTERLNDYVVAC